MKRASMFLIELVCALSIFAVCAAVCVGLLAKAKRISDESGRLTDAVLLAQDAAERLRAGQAVTTFQRDGYEVTAAPASGDTEISVFFAGEEIYTLHVKGAG